MPIHTIQLKYTGSNIAKAENEAGKNFMNVVATIATSPAISDLKFLFDAGGASDDDFDKAFSEGVDNVVLIIMRGLNDSGFLGGKLDIEAIEKEMQERREKVQEITKVSETSGEANKA